MAVNTRTIEATPEKIWDVLSDGWLYPVWVVGASRMREVEGPGRQSGASCTTPLGSGPFSLTTTPR